LPSRLCPGVAPCPRSPEEGALVFNFVLYFLIFLVWMYCALVICCLFLFLKFMSVFSACI